MKKKFLRRILRLGGLIESLNYCKDRLKKYLQGKIDCIKELEKEFLAYGENFLSGYFNGFLSIASSNPM